MRWSVILLAACSPVGTPVDVTMCGDDSTSVVDSDYAPPEVGPSDLMFPRAMVVDPDPELLPFVQESARRYLDRLGLRVEVATGGIPIRVRDQLTYSGNPVDGLAKYNQ